MKLYSTKCPKCLILEKKMKAKNIKFEICEDIETMIDKGIDALPVLEIDNKLLCYKDAVDYINTL